MTEYNSFPFDQNPWAFPPGQQSPPYPPFQHDGLALLDPSQPPQPWTNWFPSSSSATDPAHREPSTSTPNAAPSASASASEPQAAPPQLEPHSAALANSTSPNFLPPLQPADARNALKNLVAVKDESPKESFSPREHPPASAPASASAPNPNPNPNPAPGPASVLQSFLNLNGYNMTNPYAPAVSQEDYIRLLKQAAAQQHATNSMFGFAPPPGGGGGGHALLGASSAPSPSPSSARPSSSSSTHSHPLYPQPSTSATATATFSLPTPAQFNHHPSQQSHHSRPHERTPSTNSSIRTSSNERVGGGGGSVLDSPRGTYPTYPSPQPSQPLHAQHSNPYLAAHFGHSNPTTHLAALGGGGGAPAAAGEGYNPSEPYIALSLPSHHHPFLPSTASSSGSPYHHPQHPGSPVQGAPLSQSRPHHHLPHAVASNLGFCPPAPGPLRSVSTSSGLQYSSSSSTDPQNDGGGGGGYGSDGKGKGKMVDDGTREIPGFVPPKAGPSSSNGRSSAGGGGGSGTRATSVGSSNGGGGGGARGRSGSRKRGFAARGRGTHPGGEDEDDDDEGDGTRDDEDADGDERSGDEDDPEDEPAAASGGPARFSRAPVASTAAAKPTSIILPNSIDPVTGQLRRQTEVPAVEDDPSVRPYGCNYCFLDRTVDASIKAYWEQQERLHDGYKVSWRTVKELREHTQRDHKERLEMLKEHEQMVKDEGHSNGKGPDLPYRCALEPCGKTFKSLAGLRFHFQNASANGHFFVTLEKDQQTGEERAMKKFKQDVQTNGRELSCPVDRCPKRFKQSAGLAYHLSHTPNHEITEALVSTFENTLQSKTRWWFRKLGLEFAR
ncbi:hypothetical protein JCM11491_004748 [Sporobolomyces phaffii]